MNQYARWIYTVLIVIFVPVEAHGDDVEIIDYRKHVMQTLGEHVQALSMTVQKKAPAVNFDSHVKALALASNQALEAFEPKVAGGNAKPEVWANWQDFSGKMKELISNFEALDRAAEKGGMSAAAPMLDTSLTCQGCHDRYWVKKPAPAPAKAESDAVKYRRHIMKALDAQSSALGQILAMEITDDNLVSHFDVIAVTAAGALKSFEPKAPGGEAKSEVWSNWADFAKRMNEFAQKSAATARLARAEGKEAAISSSMEALTCKGCHDNYRDQK